MAIHVNSPLKKHCIKFFWMDTLCKLFSTEEYLDGCHIFSIEYSNGHFHGPMDLYDEIPRSTGTEALNILTTSA